MTPSMYRNQAATFEATARMWCALEAELAGRVAHFIGRDEAEEQASECDRASAQAAADYWWRLAEESRREARAEEDRIRNTRALGEIIGSVAA